MPTPENLRNLAATVEQIARRARLSEDRAPLFEARERLLEYARALADGTLADGEQDAENTWTVVVEDDPPQRDHRISRVLGLVGAFETMRDAWREGQLDPTEHYSDISDARDYLRAYAPEDVAETLANDLGHLGLRIWEEIGDVDYLLSSTVDYLSGDVMRALRGDQETNGITTGRWASSENLGETLRRMASGGEPGRLDMSGVRPSGPPISRRPRRALDLRDPEERAEEAEARAQPAPASENVTLPETEAQENADIFRRCRDIQRMLGWTPEEAVRKNVSYPNTSEVILLATHLDRLETMLRRYAETGPSHDGGASLKRLIRSELGQD